MKELVSIVLPNYNKGRFLEDTLDSILSQTYKYLEVIVVDDGSTDNSLEILRNYEKKDNRIKVHFNEHLGKIEALNYGLSKANGRYVKIFGSDDFMQENVIEDLINICYDYDIIAHNCLVTDEQLNVISDRFIDMNMYTTERITIDKIIDGVGFPSGLYFMKKEIADLLFPLDTSISYEDWYIFMVLALNNIQIKYLDKSLGMYRQVKNSAYGGIDNYSKKIYEYRTKRDIIMLKYFLKILPEKYTTVTRYRISSLDLSINGNLFDILRSNHSFNTKMKIIIKKYLYNIYYLYHKFKSTI